MAPSAENGDSDDSKRSLIFVYGTLKRGFPNHFLVEDLIRSNDAVPMISSSPSSNTYRTVQPYPLVRGPLGIPYLLNIGGSGNCIRGELYSVSPRGLDRLDELEGISYGHYERLPIKVKKVHVGVGTEPEPEPEIIEAAEAYFAHRSYAEDMWRKTGKVGIEEYTADDVASYIKVEDRPAGISFVDGIRAYLSSFD